MRLWLFICTALLSSIATAQPAPTSSFLTGNDLKEDCNQPVDAVRSSACTGYTVGIADALAAGNSINGYRACFPSGVTRGQVRDVVAHFLDQHPADRHLPAVGLTAIALSAAFPCYKGSS